MGKQAYKKPTGYFFVKILGAEVSEPTQTGFFITQMFDLSWQQLPFSGNAIF
ncbi:hypothetical protein [Mucilaginibacter sp. HD30]